MGIYELSDAEVITALDFINRRSHEEHQAMAQQIHSFDISDFIVHDSRMVRLDVERGYNLLLTQSFE